MLGDVSHPEIAQPVDIELVAPVEERWVVMHDYVRTVPVFASQFEQGTYIS